MTIAAKDTLAYIKTYKSVLRDIKAHDISPGTRLLPLTEMAKKYKVSYMTVQRAVKMLQDEGVLEAKRGGGIFVNDPGGNLQDKENRNNNITASSKTIVNNTGEQNKTKNISAIVPYWVSWHGKAAVYSTIKGFMEIGEKQGWKIDLVFKQDNFVDLDFSNKMLKRGVEGLLWIAPNPWDLANIVRLIDNGLEIVTTGRGFPEIPLDAVEVDLLDMGAKIVEYCISNNHEKMLILSANIKEPFIDTISASIVEGIRKAVKARKMPFADDQICQVCMPPDALKHTKMALEEHPDANAIVIMSETIIPAIEALEKNNFYKNPSSMVIINCTGEHGINPDYIGRIPVLKVSRPYEKIGQVAALRFMEKWEGKKLETPDLKVKLITPN